MGKAMGRRTIWGSSYREGSLLSLSDPPSTQKMIAKPQCPVLELIERVVLSILTQISSNGKKTAKKIEPTKPLNLPSKYTKLLILSLM